MSFYSAKLLWWLLAVPALYIALVILGRKKKQNLHNFAGEKVLSRIAPELDWKYPARKNIFWILSLTFLVLALARPQWGLKEEVLKTSGMDIMVLLDISNSMMVEDVMPSRLKKAKHAIRTLADNVHGDRIGIVAFAGSAFVSCPLTTDIPYVKEMLDIIDPKDIQNQGTNFTAALETTLKSFTEGAESNAVPGSRAVMIFSDGEDHEPGAVEEMKKLKELGVKVFAFGVGTEKGGPVPVRDENGELKGYKRDPRGQTVVSTFQPKTMRLLADAAEGTYSNLTESEVEIISAVGDLSGLSRTEVQEKKVIVKKERYQIPLALALIFALIEISLPMRRKVPNLFARTGTAASILLLLFGMSAGEAQAVGLNDYYKNEKAKKALEEGNVETAAPLVEELNQKNPDSPITKYNQGILSERSGDFSNAVGQFQEAAKRALVEKKNDLAAKSLYNSAVVQEKAGDLDGAIDSYLQSIHQSEQSNNPDIAQSARKNLELVQLKQQQQKNKQNENDKDQKQDNQDKSQDQQNQAQAKKFQDPAKNRRQFKSQSLDKDDAEKVLAELGQREKKLKDKLNQKKGGQAMAGGKDW